MSSDMTDIEIFDRAVYAYLSTISPKIVYAPTQNALRTITKREGFSDKKPWNFVSYYRNSSFEVNWNRMTNASTVTGDFLGWTDIDSPSRVANYMKHLPVDLTYVIEIWASKAVDVQEIAIALISKLYMQGQIIEVPINFDGSDSRFHLLDVTWNDNSDLERETEIGKIYRHTISFTIDARITLEKDLNAKRFCDIPVNIYDYIDEGGSEDDN